MDAPPRGVVDKADFALFVDWFRHMAACHVYTGSGRFVNHLLNGAGFSGV